MENYSVRIKMHHSVDETSLTDNTNQRQVFNASGSPVYTTFTNVAVENNLRNSILSPTVFYTTGAMNVMNDWYTTISERKYQNDFLWKDKKDRKNLYDPCPAGWKVPDLEDIDLLLAGLGNNEIEDVDLYPVKRILTKGSDTWELLYNGKIDGSFMSYPQDAGYLWTNTTNGTFARDLLFYSEDPYIGNPIEKRNQGHTIRCIKDTHAW